MFVKKNNAHLVWLGVAHVPFFPPCWIGCPPRDCFVLCAFSFPNAETICGVGVVRVIEVMKKRIEERLNGKNSARV